MLSFIFFIIMHASLQRHRLRRRRAEEGMGDGIARMRVSRRAVGTACGGDPRRVERGVGERDVDELYGGFLSFYGGCAELTVDCY